MKNWKLALLSVVMGVNSLAFGGWRDILQVEVPKGPFNMTYRIEEPAFSRKMLVTKNEACRNFRINFTALGRTLPNPWGQVFEVTLPLQASGSAVGNDGVRGTTYLIHPAQGGATVYKMKVSSAFYDPYSYEPCVYTFSVFE